MENVAIELKSYSQTIKLLKSLFVGSTAEALLTRQFVLRTVQHRIGRKLKADRQNSPREQKRPWSGHWALQSVLPWLSKDKLFWDGEAAKSSE